VRLRSIADNFHKQAIGAAGVGGGVLAAKNPVVAAAALPFMPVVHKYAIRGISPLTGIASKLLQNSINKRGLSDNLKQILFAVQNKSNNKN
jgi:galactitol-specific phosphotransferase system IIC component